MKDIVPWEYVKNGYVNFAAVPRASKKGKIHVGHLSFNPKSYPGGGIYLEDSLTLLSSTDINVLMAKVVSIRPKADFTVTASNAFQWEADGAMVHGAHCFMMTSLVAYALVHHCPLPQP